MGVSERPPKISNLMDVIRECLDRHRYLDTRHATDRQLERSITRPEVIYVLRGGHHEKSKDRFDEQYAAWNYSVRGRTVDRKEIRIIVSFDESTGMLIITAIDLRKRG